MNRLLIKKQAKASLKGKWGRALGLCFVAALLTSIIPAIFYGIGFGSSSTTQTAEGVKITAMTPAGAIFMIIGVVVLVIIAPLFSYGTVKAFLKANRGEDFTVGNVFDGFKEKPGKTICTGILQFLVIWLCYFIPSFIAGIFLGTAANRMKLFWDYVWSNNHGRVEFFVKHVGPRLTLSLMFFTLAIILGVIATFMYAMVYYVRVDNPDMSVVQILKTSRKIMHGRKLDFFVLGISFIGWVMVCYITCGIGFLWLAPYMQACTAAFYDDAKDNII